MHKEVRQAVIMVGGKGTRLKPLTDTCPKPILSILDRPCLDYFIDSLVEGGIRHVILACGYRSEQIEAAIGNGNERGILIEYSHEERPMGTAGAIKMLEDRLDEVFIAANGDIFSNMDIGAQIEEHMDSGAKVTISLTEVENPCEFGIARTDNFGRILEFFEKPKPEEVFSNLINSGVYVIDKDILKLIPENRAFDFSKDLVPILIRDEYLIQGHIMKGLWMDIGRPPELFEANLLMAGRSYKGYDWSGHLKDSSVSGEFYAGENSILSASDAYSSVVLKECNVRNSVIRRSLIFSDTEIENSVISNCIIGRNCRISGTDLKGVVIADNTVMDKSAAKRSV